MQSTYKYHENFIYRIPLIPVQKKLLDNFDFLNYTKQPFFKEAIYLASPVLYNELIKWHSGEIKEKKTLEKTILSLRKYYYRMQSRCTPYGLFAACGIGQWSDRYITQINTSLERYTRLDMQYACGLVEKLNKNLTLRSLIKFYPNSSIYILGDTYRYAEYKYQNNLRVHQLSSVDFNIYLQSIINLAKEGKSIDELCSYLKNEQFTSEESQEYINELIDNQILISELEPCITGDEFINQILSILKNRNSANNNLYIDSIIKLLKNVKDQMFDIDNRIGNNIVSYRQIHELLKKLDSPIEESRLFQTDLFQKASNLTIGTEIQNQLIEALDFINRLIPNQENPNIQQFKSNFLRRYENAEIPLLEALDIETGIGYVGTDDVGVNLLLNNIHKKRQSPKSHTINWDEQQNLLHRKLIDSIKQGHFIVPLSDDDLKDIDNKTAILPDSLMVMFKIINKNCILLQNCGGSSAANLLGRFAHGNKKINETIKEIVEHEQNIHPDKILAEIVHLPESRHGNILLRPVFRGYEIPYLGKSSAPLDNQILLEDLFISIKHNKIILRSSKLNKEIIPRLTSAHNYSNNALPLYQFLCDLQSQYYEKISLGFNWGELRTKYNFLPRATYKNIVLKKAQWQLEKSDFSNLLNCETNEFSAILIKWLKHWNIPQYILLIDNDNELLINFNDLMSVKMFVSCIKSLEFIILEEFLFDIDNLLIKDENESGYTHEFIATLLKVNNVENSPFDISKKNHIVEKNDEIKRNFYLGEKWLYYKFYCGIKTADKILTEVIKPLTEELIKNNFINEFFFVRYSDPDLHIRLRFSLTNPENTGHIILMINKYISRYTELKLITRIQTDTYKRELERYGRSSMELSESFFFIDSISTLSLLDQINNENSDHIRLQYALKSIEDVLELFNYSLVAKIEFMRKIKTSFFEEHNGGKNLKIQLDNKFRIFKNEIKFVLNEDLFETYQFAPLLKEKKEKLKVITKQIMALNFNNQLNISITDLVTSYVHMMLNRIFNAQQRTCELVVYDILYKYYVSFSAKESIQKNNKID